jgi:hypothetical protein
MRLLPLDEAGGRPEARLKGLHGVYVKHVPPGSTRKELVLGRVHTMHASV